VKLFHAICPVHSFKPADWVGWTIVGTESVAAPAGVHAHVAEHRIDRAYPQRVASKGATWDVHHLTRPRGEG